MSSARSERGDVSAADSASKQVLEALNADRVNNHFTDFEVFADGVSYKCHKIVLAATSQFFRGLFDSGMKEEQEGKATINGIPSEIFHDLVAWMYSDEDIFTKEDPKAVLAIMLAADQLGMEVLIKKGKEYLDDIMSTHSVTEIYHLSQVLNWKDLQTDSWNYMVGNFVDMQESQIGALRIEEMKRLVSDHNLSSYGKPLVEDLVIENILKWVKIDPDTYDFDAVLLDDLDEDHKCHTNDHTVSQNSETVTSPDLVKEEKDTETLSGTESSNRLLEGYSWHKNFRKELFKNQSSRLTHLAELLKCSRYLLISTNCLWQTLSVDPHVRADPKCQALITQIIHFKTQLDTHQFSCPKGAMHRAEDAMVNVILSLKNKKLVYMNARGPYTEWTDISLRPSDRHYDQFSAMAYCNGVTYIFGRSGYSVDLISHDSVHGKSHTISGCQWLAPVMIPVEDKLVMIDNGDHSTDTNTQRQMFIRSIKLHQSSGAKCTITERTAYSEDKLHTFEKGTPDLLCVTSVGLKVILFWKDDQDEGGSSEHKIYIECYDLTKRISHMSSHTLDTSSHIVAFKKGDKTFALQGDGVLWGIHSQPASSCVSFSKEAQLWSGTCELSGALIVDDELLVFEHTPDSFASQCQPSETVGVEGVFKSFKCCPCADANCHPLTYIHAVLNKKSLTPTRDRSRSRSGSVSPYRPNVFSDSDSS